MNILSYLLLQAAFHRGRHISKVALTSTHDILSEVLKRRNESTHFWFHDQLFKPFESLLSFEVYDEDTQDQVDLFYLLLMLHWSMKFALNW